MWTPHSTSRVSRGRSSIESSWALVGKAELEELLREGWTIAEQSERTDEFTYKDDDGEYQEGKVHVTIYKLKR